MRCIELLVADAREATICRGALDAHALFEREREREERLRLRERRIDELRGNAVIDDREEAGDACRGADLRSEGANVARIAGTKRADVDNGDYRAQAAVSDAVAYPERTSRRSTYAYPSDAAKKPTKKPTSVPPSSFAIGPV